MMACKSSMSISMDPMKVNLQYPHTLLRFFFGFYFPSFPKLLVPE